MIKLPPEIAKRAYVSAEGEYAWQFCDLDAALEALSALSCAVLGGEIWWLKGANRVEVLPGRFGVPVWDTEPRSGEETWSQYCHRTVRESMREIRAFQVEQILKDNLSQGTCFHVTFAEESAAVLLVPRHKHDLERARAAVAAGYPKVESILPELLEWIQDMNWPVGKELAPFLASIGTPLVPHLQTIFESNDGVWKYWVLSEIMQESPAVTLAFRDELLRIAHEPTAAEIEEELDQEAMRVLVTHGLG